MPNRSLETTPLSPPLQHTNLKETQLVSSIGAHTEAITGQPHDPTPASEKNDKIQIFVDQISQPKPVIKEEPPKKGLSHELERFSNWWNTAIRNRGGHTSASEGLIENIERQQKKAEIGQIVKKP